MKLSKFVILDPTLFSFSFSASCELFRNGCWLLFFITNLTNPNAQRFPLEHFAKANVTYQLQSSGFRDAGLPTLPSSFPSWNILFVPFQPALSDWFWDANFPIFSISYIFCPLCQVMFPSFVQLGLPLFTSVYLHLSSITTVHHRLPPIPYVYPGLPSCTSVQHSLP